MARAEVGVNHAEALVLAARGGDAAAWDELVDRFSGLVWGVARAQGLSGADAADVSQTTWLRLAEHIHRIREPARIGAWLATTTRNEALRTLKRTRRQVLVAAPFEVREGDGLEPDKRLLDGERDAALWRAFGALSAHCKTLLRMLIADPAPTYSDISAVLGMPVGSIGPTRNRCLERLRRLSSVCHDNGGEEEGAGR